MYVNFLFPPIIICKLHNFKRTLSKRWPQKNHTFLKGSNHIAIQKILYQKFLNHKV